MTAGTNWAGNHTYRAQEVHRPTTLEQVQDVVSRARRIRVLGSRHSFTDIADSDELVSLEAVQSTSSTMSGIDVDLAAGTVTVGGGLKYGELVDVLREEGVALHNLASLPHISVAGAVATATHGSGVGNGNLATAVAALELVTSDGGIVRAARGDADFDGMVVGLGALGAVTRLTLDIEPAFEVEQRVFEGLSWDALGEHFDEITAAGYSVSLFTLWGADVDMVWVKSRTDRDVPPAGELFGATPAVVERNPVVGLDPTPCTPQLARRGPWSDRLPHFRMGFTPSTGDELQSEYLVPHGSALAAIGAVRGIADRIAPLLLTCEIRTVAADTLWLSTAYGRPSVALHFTWRPQPGPVGEALLELERVLEPVAARPHWGKVFRAGAATIAPLYERHADFLALAGRLDPRGAFRNDWLQRTLLGDG